jgi:hypothetical protein
MKVQFTPNEVKILNDTLARHNQELTHEIAHTDHREFKHILKERLNLLTSLQSQLVWGELQFTQEESDVLNEAIDQSERALYFEIARTDDRDFKHMLRDNLQLLEGAHCKITGARAAA